MSQTDRHKIDIMHHESMMAWARIDTLIASTDGV